MDMTKNGTLSSLLTVPGEHLPGLAALALAPLVAWLFVCAIRAAAPRNRAAAAMVARLDALDSTARVALAACFVGAVVHAAIVPTHWSAERRLAQLFVLDTIGFLVAMGLVIARHHSWRAASLVMLWATVIGYVWYLLAGWESPDLLGLLTTTIELGGALVLVTPQQQRTIGRSGVRWMVPSAVAIALFSLVCTSAIADAQASGTPADVQVGGPAAHGAATGATGASTSKGSSGSMGSMGSMGSGASGSTTRLSLPTRSPAGPIVWPDAMPAMSGGMHMVEANCTATPTPVQQQAAVTLVNDTVRAAAPYRSLAAAKAAGYRPVTPTGLPVVHYINPELYLLGRVLDASSIPVLVYVNTSHGAVLSAAMYLMPLAGTTAPPQPGGCLTQWHVHTNLCFSGGSVVGTTDNGPCAAGSVHQVTRPMMHVWMVPVPGGPLSPDPSASSEVVAASRVPALAHPNGTA